MRSSKSRSRHKSNRQRSLGNVVNRVFDSSGPEGKVRGTPQQIIDKYLTLARDAQLSNDRVAEQSFLQHAEHYTRMLGEAQREMAERQAQQQGQQPRQGDGDTAGRDNSRDNGGRDNAARDNGARDSGARETAARDNGARDAGGDEAQMPEADRPTEQAALDLPDAPGSAAAPAGTETQTPASSQPDADGTDSESPAPRARRAAPRRRASAALPDAQDAGEGDNGATPVATPETAEKPARRAPRARTTRTAPATRSRSKPATDTPAEDSAAGNGTD